MIKLLKFYFLITCIPVFTVNGLRLQGQTKILIKPNTLTDYKIVPIRETLRTSNDPEYGDYVENYNIDSRALNNDNNNQLAERSLNERIGCTLNPSKCANLENSILGADIQLSTSNLDGLSFGNMFNGVQQMISYDKFKKHASEGGCPLSYLHQNNPLLFKERSCNFNEEVNSGRPASNHYYFSHNQERNPFVTNDRNMIGFQNTVRKGAFKGFASKNQGYNSVLFNSGNTYGSSQSNPSLGFQKGDLYSNIIYSPVQQSRGNSLEFSQINSAVATNNKEFNSLSSTKGNSFGFLHGISDLPFQHQYSSSSQQYRPVAYNYGSYSRQQNQILPSIMEYEANNIQYNPVILSTERLYSPDISEQITSFGGNFATSKEQYSSFQQNEGNSISFPPTTSIKLLGEYSDNQIYSGRPSTAIERQTVRFVDKNQASTNEDDHYSTDQQFNIISSLTNLLNRDENNEQETVREDSKNSPLRIGSKYLPVALEIDLPKISSTFGGLFGR